ncbi:MAG: DSD1 family PLP-dependent enzyme [Planctomycetaceae bacterium]|nr:DSD1 family PLP-dependent enzyme [Planctomycetaceae bacterium]
MHRRTFLATTMSTAAIAAARFPLPEGACGDEIDAGGLTKQTIPTPALVVDLDAFEANLKKMAEHCASAKRGFRPHAKTHKCPEIAKRQIAAGALGICVATVPELEALAAAGVTGLLLTSPIVDPGKIGRVIALAKSGHKLMVAVGHAREAELLAAAAESAQADVDVLVDLDVGDKRTGSLPGQPAVALAEQIAHSKRLHIRGVQAYAGHASHTVGFDDRQRVSREAMAKAVETRGLLAKAGFDAAILSGGSTGTYNIDSTIDGVSELQVGSYIFMDMDYRRIGGQGGQAIYTDFQPSLTVLTTVISATHPERVTVDAGTKAIDTTTPHRPDAKGRPGLLYAKAGDEFGAVTLEGDATLPKLGERIEFIVPHCDPSVNLYDRLYACRGERVEAIWPVEARRENSFVG